MLDAGDRSLSREPGGFFVKRGALFFPMQVVRCGMYEVGALLREHVASQYFFQQCLNGYLTSMVFPYGASFFERYPSLFFLSFACAFGYFKVPFTAWYDKRKRIHSNESFTKFGSGCA